MIQKYLQIVSGSLVRFAIKEAYASLFWFTPLNRTKFIPKYPYEITKQRLSYILRRWANTVKKVKGRNRIVTSVNCFMLSFWLAPVQF